MLPWPAGETRPLGTGCCRRNLFVIGVDPIADSALIAIERFALSNTLTGHVEARDSIEAFNADCGGVIPSWYCEALSRFPLCGVEIEWPDPDDEGEFTGVQWMGIAGMRSEMLECYPGVAIRPHGYICIAGCTFGSGDQYYICNRDGDDPAVYQIYHGVSDVADEIIASGRDVAFPKLSELFEVACIA